MKEQMTLKEVRKAIADADKLRTDVELAKESRLEMERMAVGLRKLERELISGMQDDINERLEAAVSGLKELSAEIRTKASKMDGPAKTLKHLKDFFKTIDVILKTFTI